MFRRSLLCVSFLAAVMIAASFLQTAPYLLEGDVYPPSVPAAMPQSGVNASPNDQNGDGDALDAGEFGDGLLNTLDLIAILRATTAIPGYVPPARSDLFDAMDVYPPDTATTRGGDGVLNTLDLNTELQYVTKIGTPTHRLPRFAWGRAPFETPLWAAGGSPGAQAGTAASPAGTVVFDPPVTDASGKVRVAFYLLAQRNISLVGVAHGFGIHGSSANIHLDATTGVVPTLQDEALPGIVCAAWLKGIGLTNGQKLQLGTIEVTNLAGQALPAQVWMDVYRIVTDEQPDTSVQFSHPQSVRVK